MLCPDVWLFEFDDASIQQRMGGGAVGYAPLGQTQISHDHRGKEKKWNGPFVIGLFLFILLIRHNISGQTWNASNLWNPKYTTDSILVSSQSSCRISIVCSCSSILILSFGWALDIVMQLSWFYFCTLFNLFTHRLWSWVSSLYIPMHTDRKYLPIDRHA